MARDLPVRLRDLPVDWSPRGRSVDGIRIPPPRLRARVGASSSRTEFLEIGRRCAEDLLSAYRAAGRPADGDGRWLDFGSGCGRVARHLFGRSPISDYRGVDVDRAQIAWAGRHLPGRFSTIAPAPPMAFAGESFDVVFTISVFTHLDEAEQIAWLEELRRLLRPGGLLIATTHAPRIAVEARGAATVGAGELDALERTGFLFRPSVGPFNEQAAFHSREYLSREWGGRYGFVAFHPAALGGFQDISLWEKS